MGDSAKWLLLPEHADADLVLQFLSRRRAASALTQEPQVSLTGALWDPPMAGWRLGPHHDICLNDFRQRKQHIFSVGLKSGKLEKNRRKRQLRGRCAPERLVRVAK